MKRNFHWLNELKKLTEQKPIAILRIEGDEWTNLRQSRYGVNEFTIVRPHALFEAIRAPALCLIQGKDSDSECLYLGLISSQSAIATLQTRIKVKCGMQIQPQSESELLQLVTERPHTGNLKNRLRESKSVIVLSAKLSSNLIERLASINVNQDAMRKMTESLSSPKYFRGPEGLQEDALRTALKAFGLTPNDRALSLELVQGKETALARVNIMEDSVIEHDARQVPGYKLIKSDVTGRAIFERDNEQLEVFTANRRPLEHVFGVDLIYLNASKQNIVMLQYKMLEPLHKESEDTDWVYRPDGRLNKEIARMQKFSTRHKPGKHEYRLNPAVFYLKFVKRDGSISNGGIITPLDHFEKLRKDPSCKGPNNGLRVSYKSLGGRYLRQIAFLDLIRSGYIGAHAEMTTNLKTLIDVILKGNRAIIVAIQQTIKED